jgi:hypothetical protein
MVTRIGGAGGGGNQQAATNDEFFQWISVPVNVIC